MLNAGIFSYLDKLNFFKKVDRSLSSNIGFAQELEQARQQIENNHQNFNNNDIQARIAERGNLASEIKPKTTQDYSGKIQRFEQKNQELLPLSSGAVQGYKVIPQRFNLDLQLFYKFLNAQNYRQKISYAMQNFLFQFLAPQLEALVKEAIKIIVTRKNGQYLLQLQLEPEELGEICLTLRIEDDTLSLEVKASKDIEEYFLNNKSTIKKMFAKFKKFEVMQENG